MTLLVSVIVPIYNTSTFLEKCIESLLKQTYENLEILLINDGSTDNSEFVCKYFEKRDNRVKYYFKENGGLSSARNFGLDRIKGDYISFIDSDDSIDENFIYTILSNCVDQGSLIGMCGRFVFNNSFKKDMFTLPEPVLWDSYEAFGKFLIWESIDGSVCDKIFHSSLFLDRRFPEGRISEDLPVFASALTQSGKIIHVGKPLYFYYKREGSITNSKFSRDKITILDSVNEVLSMVKINFPALKYEANYYFVIHIFILYGSIKNEVNSYKSEFNFIRENIKNKIAISLFNPYLSIKQKIKLLLIYLIKNVKFI